MKKLIKDLHRFSVSYNYSKNECETNTFETLGEAEKAYNEIAKNILSETNSLENSHWRNNTEGLSCELRELTHISTEGLENLNDSETEEDQLEVWSNLQFTFSKRLKTKYTFLSDEVDENLGKNGEFIVKENEIYGTTYATYFGEKPECILISDIIENSVNK